MLQVDVVERIFGRGEDNGFSQALKRSHDDPLALKTVADTRAAFPPIQASLPGRSDRGDYEAQDRDCQHNFQQGESRGTANGWKIGRMANRDLRPPISHLFRFPFHAHFCFSGK